MKAVILAGGLGTRLSEETHLKPKPMVEIGGRPIIWHILKMYSSHGVNDFVICAGYKGYIIKEYFANYFLHMSDVTFDMVNNTMEVHQKNAEPWQVTIVDTGEETMTGGRIKRIAPYLDGPFCLTYGDGVGDIDISASIEFHKKSGLLATLTGVQPPGRFGSLQLDKNRINSFIEKPLGDGSWINGGFFILDPMVIDYIAGDSIIWEREPLEKLAQDRQLGIYRHNGFWRPMDTLRDKSELEDLWEKGDALWKTW
ncbi:glucose-1-phosphate cytidylyltransferase [Akkermansiaceae bacterium]|nr:glucose-1-phosphate cytidylyltransferase [bacterium]MDB4457692.1 glucose-1-phosphate cytidylyltransferase [Akkermansiaceae bacterium]